MLSKTNPTASTNIQKKFKSRRRESTVLASANISERDSAVVAADLFNEPIASAFGNTSNEYVPFFDSKSSFVNKLLALSNNSPTLRRIIQDKSAMVLGDGFIVNNSSISPMLSFLRKAKKMLGIKDKNVYEINEKLLVVNKNQENLQQVLEKGIVDYNTLGNAFFEIVTISTSEGKKTFLYHIPVYMVAFKKMESDFVVKEIGVKEIWEFGVNHSGEVRRIPLYPTIAKIEETDGTVTERTAISVKKYAAGFSYWGLPDWIAAKHFAEIEYRVGRFQINEFKNSFNPSSIVTFYGNMTQDEAKTLLGDFKETYSGENGESKIFGQVVRNSDFKADVKVLNNEKEGSYLDLVKMASQMIITASRWTKSLAGFSESGQLGTNQQIRSEIELLQNTVIKPIQNLFSQSVLQTYINKVAENDPVFKNISLEFSNNMPISFLGEIDVKAILSVNEQREIAGYQNVEENAAI